MFNSDFVQLDFLSYVPSPEEILPPAREQKHQAISQFKLSDRVTCPDGSGSVYAVTQHYVWVAIGNVAKPWEEREIRKL